MDLHPPLIDLLFQQARVGLCLLDSEGKVRRANAEWLRLLGRSFENAGREGLVGRLDEVRRKCAEAGWELTDTPAALDDGDGVLVTVTENSPRKAPMVDLTVAASETRHRMVFNAMNEAFALHEVVLDDRGEPCNYRFLEVNPAFERLTGLPNSEVLGRLVTEAIPGVDREWIKIYGKVAMTGQSTQFDRYEGALARHFEVLAFSPAPMQFAVLFLDVTSRKQAEQALRESERHYRLLADNATDVIWTLDLASRRFTYLSPSVERLRGLTVEEGLKEPMEQSLTPESLARVLEVLARVGTPQEEDPHVGVYDLTCKDGSVKHVEMTTTLLRDNGGRPVQVLGVSRDATARVLSEKALRESDERYRAVVTSMAEGVLVQDTNGRILMANPAAEGILGITADGAGERPPADPRWQVIAEDGHALAAEEFPPVVALRTGISQRNVVLGFHKPDDTFAWVKGNSTPLRDGAGDTYGVLSTISDITERRALRERLTVASRLAAMGTLVRGVAHEINNPLAALMSNLAMVIDEAQAFKERLNTNARFDRDDLTGKIIDVIEMLADAKWGTERIARIVHDLTTIGSPNQPRVPVNLLDVVREAVTGLPPAVAEKSVVRVEPALVPAVLGSAIQLERVVSNLVTNAALATPEGERSEITIRLGVADPGTVHLEVSDKGKGISPTVMDHIFDPFFTTQDVGKGMGLGLPLCHAIVAAHGGTITATSVPGHGAKFRVELPAMASA